MNPFQKMAWFNLGVVLFTVTLFIALYSTTGNLGGSLPAFGCLALAAFSGLFLSGGKGRAPLWDEYHKEINSRAISMAARVGCFYFLCGGWVIMHINTESVRGDIFAAYLWGGLPLLIAVQSLAMLLFYGSDSSERRTLLDRWRGMSDLRRGAARTLISLWIITPVFLVVMQVARNNVDAFGKMISIDAVFLVVYLLLYKGLGQFARNEDDTNRLRQARKQSLISMASAVAAVLFVTPIVLWVGFQVPWTWFCLYHVYFVLMIGLLTLPLGLVIQMKPRTGKAGRRETTTVNGG